MENFEDENDHKEGNYHRICSLQQGGVSKGLKGKAQPTAIYKIQQENRKKSVDLNDESD